jgi:hypothetical protein
MNVVLPNGKTIEGLKRENLAEQTKHATKPRFFLQAVITITLH